MSRSDWLKAICAPDWKQRKPELQYEGRPYSLNLIGLLRNKQYREMYIKYLFMKGRQPTVLLLQDLKRSGLLKVAAEIKEEVGGYAENIS